MTRTPRRRPPTHSRPAGAAVAPSPPRAGAVAAARHPLRRRPRLALVAALAGALALWLAATHVTAAPVGHFRSAQGRDRYLAAYDRALARLPDPAEIRDVRTAYGVVRLYRYAGARPGGVPLLLLPGSASGSPVWGDDVPSFLADRDVWTLDLLGEPGRSIQDRPIRDAADQAAWLDEAIAAVAPRVHLVGMSFGGWTAANLTTRRPARVASLTLLEPVLVFADLRLEVIARSIPASVPWLPKAWRDDFASWTAGGAPLQDDPVAQMIEAGMQGYQIATPPPARLDEAALAAIRVPALVVLGGRSPMHDAQEASATARRVLPAARVVVLPDGTHAVNGEYSEAIAAAVRDLTAADATR
ncbi:alpha/beta fold hydrolase [Agilicoccus flavus]|uniref:alpha/beta fold hydrolase n=1 Tax=Agilicoccus flavus TaxID=2775968 RepID=UPI001CF6727C|nr:alpha/beta fold hydrolase [Agilicoccus flavus]